MVPKRNHFAIYNEACYAIANHQKCADQHSPAIKDSGRFASAKPES
jgi:hypothetical protein